MTASYKILVKRSAEKELRAVPKPFLSKIVQKIQSLSSTPRPAGCEALAGHEGGYRIRQNDYRIVYVVDDAKKEVTLIKVGHRSDVYR